MTHRLLSISSLLASLLLLVGGCSSGSNFRTDDDDSTDDDDTAVGDDDTSVDDDDTSVGDDDDDDDDDDDTTGDDDDSAIGGTLIGTITRSAALPGDGVGLLVVVVLDEEPDPNGAPGVAASEAFFPGTDLSGVAAFSYEVVDIPLRPNPYWVGVIFDDSDPDPDNFQPGPGMLVASLGEGLFPTVVVNDLATPAVLDLDLNMVMP